MSTPGCSWKLQQGMKADTHHIRQTGLRAKLDRLLKYTAPHEHVDMGTGLTREDLARTQKVCFKTKKSAVFKAFSFQTTQKILIFKTCNSNIPDQQL